MEDWGKRIVRSLALVLAQLLSGLADTLDRYLQVSVGSRGLWSKRAVPCLPGVSIVAHYYIPSPAPSEHKQRHIPSFNTNRALDSSSGTEGFEVQRPWNLCYGQ